MNEKTAAVIAGWHKLKDSEKREFLNHLREYERASFSEKNELRANIAKIATGPVGMSCPCCGR